MELIIRVSLDDQGMGEVKHVWCIYSVSIVVTVTVIGKQKGVPSNHSVSVF